MPSLIRNYSCHHFYDVVRKCRQKKSLHKFAPSAKKPTKAVAAAEQVDAATAVPNTYKHTHTHRHELLLRWCECKQKADQTRAQYTLAVVVVPTRIAANVEQQQRQTNQTGRAEPAANANKQQQQRQRKQLRRRFCGDCTFFQHTTRNTPPCGAQSASTAAAATVPIRKVFQCSPASRRVVTNVARVVLSCAVYVDVCLCERASLFAFVKFHYQFVSYETEMALQQQRTTTAGVAKKHVESSFFSCSLPLTHSLTLRRHVNTCVVLLSFQLLPIQNWNCPSVCLSLSLLLSMYSS